MSGLPGTATQPYVIRRLHSSGPLSLVFLAAFVGVAAAVDLPFPTWIIAVFAALALYRAWQGSERLRVDASGVRMLSHPGQTDQRGTVRRAVVPWPSIRALVLVGDGELGVRLVPGAPLPQGVRGIITEPAQPDAGEIPDELRLRVRGIDRDRLRAAVTGFAGDVEVVEQPALGLS